MTQPDYNKVVDIFEILIVSPFQICLELFFGIILSKVTDDLVDQGEISECSFEDFEKS